MSFVHLHTHSHYSLLSALPKIPELVKEAKRYDMPALALTDNGNLYGAIEFYKTCTKEGIKPIIGSDFYEALKTRYDRRPGIDNKRFRFVLLAKNNQGYQNLIELVTKANLTGFYYKPRIDEELKREFPAGLISIIPCLGSRSSHYLQIDDLQAAIEYVERQVDIYGKDNVYLEITDHPELTDHDKLVRGIRELSQKTGVETLAAHDIYYLNPEDRTARETLLSVQSSGNFKRRYSDEDNFSFLSSTEMLKRFADDKKSLRNAMKVAESCNVELELGEWVFPDFEIPEGTTYDQELRKMALRGIEYRGLEKTDELMERLEYELDVIKTKGYAPYFLVVGDFLHFAHDNDIPTTIRGSVTGSLVTYLCRITNLNPLEYGLVFERFLNPERPSAPDIDMDFADERRDEVIDYAREKYGKDKVAQIGTFGTMAARGSVRDVTRALGHDYDTGDKIAKLIPLGRQGFPMTIERALDESEDLAELYKSDEMVKEIVDMAQKVEGCARHISVHAAGVVISPTKLTDFVPLERDTKKGKLITQYDMHSVEDAGLLKFDFLGLKNLSILSNTTKIVEKRRGEKINLEDIPVDDRETYELLSRGETNSLFQLNGSGMTHFLKELKPTDIHDINAMVALYRPGPMDFIPEYIKRKQNPDLVDYPHEDLKEDLKNSYGLLIYQEDVMMTAIKLAGYSWLEADKFRKAMGKKIPELMAKQEEKFKSGCIENGIEPSLAEDLWERIKPFAAYAFNKAHAASYGRVAYQTAYLKAHYPVEYMAAVLTADAGNIDKIHDIVGECKRMGIEVLPPDINESFGNFTVVTVEGEDKIRFGLYSIKNLGNGISDVLIEERKRGGRYESLIDIATRIQDRSLNRKSLEALIKCGALDSLGERAKMLHNLDDILEHAKLMGSQSKDQGSLFGAIEDKGDISNFTLEDRDPATNETRLEWEKDLLGLYVSGHPLDKFRDKLGDRKQKINFIKNKMKPGMVTVVAGLLESVKTITTRKGDPMAFGEIADYTDKIEIVFFPGTYDKYQDLLEEGTCIAIRGKINDRNGELNVVADKIRKL